INITYCLEKSNSNNLTCDCNKEISLIIYIASLTEDITPNDVEAASKIIYYSIVNISKNDLNILKNLF
ncbi:hypothetical protein NQ314_013804, partial [Rhamnusium bicolor]